MPNFAQVSLKNAGKSLSSSSKYNHPSLTSTKIVCTKYVKDLIKRAAKVKFCYLLPKFVAKKAHNFFWDYVLPNFTGWDIVFV